MYLACMCTYVVCGRCCVVERWHHNFWVRQPFRHAHTPRGRLPRRRLRVCDEDKSNGATHPSTCRAMRYFLLRVGESSPSQLAASGHPILNTVRILSRGNSSVQTLEFALGRMHFNLVAYGPTLNPTLGACTQRGGCQGEFARGHQNCWAAIACSLF